MQTQEYAPGRSVDLYGAGAPTVLLWHGTQTDSRAAVRPLAERLAGHGLLVVAADWNSHAADGGRADLLASARFAADQSADGSLTVVGWSLGGAAAAGLMLDAHRYGVAVRRMVGLAGAFMARNPLTGGALLDGAPSGEPVPALLLHGADDDVVPVAASRDFAAALRGYGWPAQYVEIAADHGTIAGARYDAAGDRYDADDDPATLAVAADVAARIAGAVAP
jgi:dienelactone hydrolase